MGSRGKKIVSLVKEQNSEKLQNIKNTENQAQTKLQVGDIIDVGVCSNILKIVNVENIVEMDSNNEVLNDPDLKCYYLANNNDAGLLEIDNHNLLKDQLLFDKNGTVTDESTELPKINLVDYDSSSSNIDFDMSTKPKAQAKSNQRKLRRRSSEMSFNEGKEKISSDSEEYWSDLEKQVRKPVKKKSKLEKRKSRMIEKSYGKGKALQPNPCKTNCPNQCTLKFPEVVRQDIHEFYWGLGNSQRQRDWLLSCIKQVGIKRRRQEAETSRRHTTFKYVIPWNDVEHRVCQKFLLKTLDISQMTLRYTKNFLDWKQLSNEVLQPKKFKSVEGESIKITQVRSVYIEKNNSNVVIDYSYDGSDIKIMKIALPKKVNLKSKRLYSNKLCVTPIKKKNLEDLCKKNVIPRKYHQEYFNMNTSDKISDVLPETDQEDEVEELKDQ
ncbi:unnamed protein product [Psylliodes chrysocephalus]|uniref:Uncharacterized protein n=1 Tax=Psylliodes chrysocephalus TaxID=3402493 RepID=A0A9P0CPV4_9CUCU|nr:unnamed protein product [Psylliodes chrysocephala]